MSTPQNVIALTPATGHTAIPVMGAPPQLPDTAAVYTVAEVAGMLRMSLGVVYGMARAGQLPARQIGRRWLIPRDRFHTWLDQLPDATDKEVDQYFGVR